jgi:histidyl-tRNA synthetase
VSRLLSALQAVGSPLAHAQDKRGPVVVLVMDKSEIAHYQGLVAKLRTAGIRSELYLGAAGMNAQLKYADRRGAVCAVIQGSNERTAAGGSQVMIRDLVLGAELAAASKDRADYLELRQRAQFPVAEAQLVEAVQEVLGRYAR